MRNLARSGRVRDPTAGYVTPEPQTIENRRPEYLFFDLAQGRTAQDVLQRLDPRPILRPGQHTRQAVEVLLCTAAAGLGQDLRQRPAHVLDESRRHTVRHSVIPRNASVVRELQSLLEDKKVGATIRFNFHMHQGDSPRGTLESRDA